VPFKKIATWFESMKIFWEKIGKVNKNEIDISSDFNCMLTPNEIISQPKIKS